jgi:tetratricopeptide (TPR) repeat protein
VRSFRPASAFLLVVSLSAAEPDYQRRLEISPSSADANFTALLDRYARGEATDLTMRESVFELQRQLRRAGPSWIGPRNSPDNARRRLTVATMALEILDGHLDVTFWRSGVATELLEWGCVLLRETPATEAERTWHLAAAAQLERASAFRLIRGPVSTATGNSAFVTHVVHAERRFPGDGRWALARAMDAEHAVWPPRFDEDVLEGVPDAENRIRSRLQAAFNDPLVGAEAHLRWGYFHLRRGRLAAALAELDGVGQPGDEALRYWQQLFRGHTLVQMNRRAEAIESYRLARATYPNAQAATLSLASTLAISGNAIEAGELTNAMLLAPGDDPWNVYGFPAYRNWPRWLRQLREAIAS